MSGHVVVIGIGPGGPEYVLPAAIEAAASCDLWVGSEMAVKVMGGQTTPPSKVITMAGHLSRTVDDIRTAAADQVVGVIVTGDPLVYSLLGTLRRELNDIDIKVIPGISSVQLALAHLGLELPDVRIGSVHGRDPGRLGPLVVGGDAVLLLTDKTNHPAALAAHLIASGADNRSITVLDSLGRPDETIIEYSSAKDLAADEQVFRNAIMYVSKIADVPGQPVAVQDERLMRGNVPVTKEEIRHIVCAKMLLARNSVVYDIGAGTGAVTSEISRTVSSGRVYAIEKKEEALRLTRENARRFGVGNVEVVPGEAPDALADLPEATAVFIGGSGPRLREILTACSSKMAEGARLVATAVTLGKTVGIISAGEDVGLTLKESLLVQLSRAKERPWILRGENPIHIFVFEKEAGDEPETPSA